MPETFLILLTGGVLLATGACDPRVVPLRWLRLSGVVALVLAGVAIGFAAFVRDVPAAGSVVVQRVQVGLITMTVALALGHVAAVPVAMVRAQRWVAVAGFAVAVLAGSHLLHASMAARGTSLYPGSKALAMALQTFACAGAAALPGLVVMAALLACGPGTHVDAAVVPLRRLTLAAGAVNAVRLALSVALVLGLQYARPVHGLWTSHAVAVAIRWGVGLVAPALFLHVAYAHLKRGEVRRATPFPLVAGVCVVVGEVLALHLIRESGLPF